MRVKRDTSTTQTHTHTCSTRGYTKTNAFTVKHTHTPSHVRKAHADEKLSVYTEDISEGIRFFFPPSAGINVAS